METSDRKQSPRVRRIRPTGVTGLELWDLWVGDRILWDCMAGPGFGAVLRTAVEALQKGVGATRSEGEIPSWVAGFTTLYLTGGGAPPVAESLEQGPWKLSMGRHTEHPTGQGGEALLKEHGLRGWVVDLGQSALKIAGEGKYQRWERDLEKLPLRSDAAGEDAQAQRTALREFMSRALIDFGKDLPELPTGVVVALPSRLDDAGLPEGSSYIGMSGDQGLIPDVLQPAGLSNAQALLLNDAELEAVSARTEGLTSGKTLVLTLGFGVGAAILEG